MAKALVVFDPAIAADLSLLFGGTQIPTNAIATAKTPEQALAVDRLVLGGVIIQSTEHARGWYCLNFAQEETSHAA